MVPTLFLGGVSGIGVTSGGVGDIRVAGGVAAIPMLRASGTGANGGGGAVAVRLVRRTGLGTACNAGERRSRWPVERRVGIRLKWMSRRARRTAPCTMKRRTPLDWLLRMMAVSTASVMESTMAFMEES